MKIKKGFKIWIVAWNNNCPILSYTAFPSILLLLPYVIKINLYICNISSKNFDNGYYFHMQVCDNALSKP